MSDESALRSECERLSKELGDEIKLGRAYRRQRDTLRSVLERIATLSAPETGLAPGIAKEALR